MVKRTPNREWKRADDDTDSFPVLTEAPVDEDGTDVDADDQDAPDDEAAPSKPVDEIPMKREVPAWVKRFGEAVVARLPRISAAVVGGLLLCLSFPPFGWWYLGIVAFAPLAWVLTRDTTKLVGGFGYGFLFGAGVLHPAAAVDRRHGGLSAVAGAVAPRGGVSRSLRSLRCRHAQVDGVAHLVRRPLGALRVGEVDDSVRRIPLGCSRFRSNRRAAAATGADRRGAAGVVRRDAARLRARRAGLRDLRLVAARRDRGPRSAPPAVVLPGACICLVLIATAAISPAVRHSGAGAADEPSVNVAAVQGNVPQLGLDFNAQRRAVLDNHVRETVRLADDVRAGRAPQPLFVIWPENSSDIDPLANQDAADQIAVAVEAIKAPILVGGVLAAPGYTRDNPVSTNSVIVWNPETGPGDRHDKKIVQPFGEYLPWRSFFKHFSEYADRAGYFQPGGGNGIVDAAGVPIGVSTCWEVIFDRSPRESVLNGAQVLTVPSNNATFNESMSVQQLAFARLRAVEHNRFVIVAGTTGISAVIAPDGRVLARTQFFEPAYLDMAIRLKTQLTPATQWGPWVQGLLVSVGIGALIAAMLHNGRFVRGRRRVTDASGQDTPPDEGGTERGTT